MSSGETFTAPHKMASLRRVSAPNKDKDNKRRSHQTIYLTWTNSSKRKTSPLTPKQTKDCFQTVAYLLTWAEPSSTDLMDFLLQEEKKGGGGGHSGQSKGEQTFLPNQKQRAGFLGLGERTLKDIQNSSPFGQEHAVRRK